MKAKICKAWKSIIKVLKRTNKENTRWKNKYRKEAEVAVVPQLKPNQKPELEQNPHQGITHEISFHTELASEVENMCDSVR